MFALVVICVNLFVVVVVADSFLFFFSLSFLNLITFKKLNKREPYEKKRIIKKKYIIFVSSVKTKR